jgi:hypothetical protein
MVRKHGITRDNEGLWRLVLPSIVSVHEYVLDIGRIRVNRLFSPVQESAGYSLIIRFAGWISPFLRSGQFQVD